MAITKSLAVIWNNNSARYIAIGIFVGLLVLFYYLVDVELFISMNSVQYIIFQITLSVIIAFLFAINVGLITLRFHQRTHLAKTCTTSVLGGMLGTLSLGCPVCGTGLLASTLGLVGIEGGLALLPFEGVELKVLSIVLLGLTLVWNTKEL